MRDDDINWPHLRPAKKIKEPSFAQLIDWLADMNKTCRCDGGNTMGCAACVAERHIKELGGEKAARQLLVPKDQRQKPYPGVKLSAEMKKDAGPHVKWICHGQYAHVAGAPCVQCGTAVVAPSRAWMLQMIGSDREGWLIRFVKGDPKPGQLVHYSDIGPINSLYVAGPTDTSNAERIKKAILEWTKTGAMVEWVLSNRAPETLK
jgi:hypothetical protein